MSSALDEEGNVRASILPYIRVSTDDKGQDPKRQLAAIGYWADREGFILLAPEEDIGTSASKVQALDRPYFIRACERAAAAGAEGIIMELPDRFSRMDPMLAVWEMVEVRNRYGLEVYFAGVPLSFQTSSWGRLMIFMQMGAAHQWVVDHTARVISGMERKRAQGMKFGRKPKSLTADELDQVKYLREKSPGKSGKGWEAIAVIINDQRRVHLLTNTKERKERGVSSGSLRRMAREGVFGPDEMEREVQSGGKPDDGLSSPSQNLSAHDDIVSAGAEVVPSRPEGS